MLRIISGDRARRPADAFRQLLQRLPPVPLYGQQELERAARYGVVLRNRDRCQETPQRILASGRQIAAGYVLSAQFIHRVEFRVAGDFYGWCDHRWSSFSFVAPSMSTRRSDCVAASRSGR
jgi:hypothetical protein